MNEASQHSNLSEDLVAALAQKVDRPERFPTRPQAAA